jgi:hypothetical protein
MKNSYFSITKLMAIVAFALIAIYFFNNEPPTVEEIVKEDPYNGIRKRYRDDGTLFAEVTYKDSIREGIARNYYRNGRVHLEMTYVKGGRHGDAITYYESGDIYQITPYVQNQRSGIQKKYYKGNILMAEIPFENNEQIPGIKEYTKAGVPIPNNEKIVFRLIDKTAFENKYDLEIRLSDNSPNAKVSKVMRSENGKENFEWPMETIKGKAVDVFYIQPGQTLMETLIYKVERKTGLGNNEVFKATYNLAIENNK